MEEESKLLKKLLKKDQDYLQDRIRMKAILNDILRNQVNKVNILLTLYFDIHIHNEIHVSRVTDVYFVGRITRKTYRDFGISEELVRPEVMFWINVLKEIPLPSSPEKVTTKLEPDTFSDGFYFPCGVGNHDFGFFLTGIPGNDKRCEHKLAALYAVIFSYLQRSLDMNPGIVYKNIERKFQTKKNYRRIYRLQLLILLLVKYNYFKNNHLELSLEGWTEIELKLALESINSYAEMLSNLAKMDFQRLDIIIKKSASVRVHERQVDGYISIINAKYRHTEDRQIWFESNILYMLQEKDLSSLMTILEESFGYVSFLPGQFDAIKTILNCETNKLCIMPTGSGKSLVYYFVALLQPCPTMVLSPTEILIQDQIEILKNKHEFDDVNILDAFENHEEFHPKNKLIFLTPLVFLSSGLIKKCINLDFEQQIAQFVLDEIHCISNWSHDFRPEYLMLSFNLKTYVDRTRLLGFSATANFTVVRDINFQLSLDMDGNDIIAPLELAKNKQKFSFIQFATFDDCLKNITKEMQEFITTSRFEKNKQMLVFTKSKSTSDILMNYLPKDIQPEAQIFSSTSTNSFSDFVNNLYKILIGDSEVGIGINLPGVTDTYHFGVPISKSQYVQEIGRGGRDNNKACSKVFCISRDALSQNQSYLLHKNTPISTLLKDVYESDLSDDMAATYRKIFGGIENQHSFTQGVILLFEKIVSIENAGEIKIIFDKNKTYDECLSQYMRYLYVLYRVGYIYNWYISNHDQKEKSVTFLVEIAEHNDLDSIIHFTTRYLLSMGEYRDAVNRIRNSESVSQVIIDYISWHFDKFLYHHREQFMEMYDFLELHKNSTDQQITTALKDYFSLSLFEVSEDAAKFNKLAIRDIFQLINQGISPKVYSDIQKSMENEYSSKHDFLLFLYNLVVLNSIDISRFERFVENLDSVDYYELMTMIDQIFRLCNYTDRISIINILCKRTPLLEVLRTIYDKIDDDVAYYWIVAKCCNQNLERIL